MYELSGLEKDLSPKLSSINSASHKKTQNVNELKEILNEINDPIDIIRHKSNRSCEISLKSSLDTLPWFDRKMKQRNIDDAVIEKQINEDTETADNLNIMILENLSLEQNLNELRLNRRSRQSEEYSQTMSKAPGFEIGENIYLTVDCTKPQNTGFDSDSMNRKEINTDFISSSDFNEGLAYLGLKDTKPFKTQTMDTRTKHLNKAKPEEQKEGGIRINTGGKSHSKNMKNARGDSKTNNSSNLR